MGTQALQPRPVDIGDETPAPALVARVVWLEIRRKEEYLALFILMGLYLMIAIGARLVGDGRDESVALMLNMGLFLSSSLAAVLTLLTASRLIPSEVENRTLYPLLAKPVHRREVILGKFLATLTAGVSAFALFTLMTTLTWVQKFPIAGQDLFMFIQAAILQVIALGLLASVALLLSLVLPKAVTILTVGMLYFAGEPILNVLRSVTRDWTVGPAVDNVLSLIPSFSNLTLLQRFTDGAPALGFGEFLGLCLYGLIPMLVFLGLASHLFERKEI
ncbi:MAG: ABC transporter permease subunit [Candidatus Omnitrophica bacterium]|nr:ABC transporter permease subunit [Candidatus Omnitrophota bacterium]